MTIIDSDSKLQDLPLSLHSQKSHLPPNRTGKKQSEDLINIHRLKTAAIIIAVAVVADAAANLY